MTTFYYSISFIVCGFIFPKRWLMREKRLNLKYTALSSVFETSMLPWVGRLWSSEFLILLNYDSNFSIFMATILTFMFHRFLSSLKASWIVSPLNSESQRLFEYHVLVICWYYVYYDVSFSSMWSSDQSTSPILINIANHVLYIWMNRSDKTNMDIAFILFIIFWFF